MVWMTEVSHFDSLQGQATFLLPKMCTAPLGPTKPTIQWIPGIKPPRHTADHSPASSTKVKKVWSEAYTRVCRFWCAQGPLLLFYHIFSLYLLRICNNGADRGATNAVLTTPLLPNIRILLSFGWLPDGGFVSCCSVFILTAMSHRLSFLEKRHTVTMNTDTLFC